MKIVGLLTTPLDLPCTQEQTQQLENRPSTYKTETNVNSEDEIEAYIDAEYVRDTELIINSINEEQTTQNTKIGNKINKYELFREVEFDNTSSSVSFTNLDNENIIAFKVIFRDVYTTEGSTANLSCNWRMKGHISAAENSSMPIGVTNYIHGEFELEKLTSTIYKGRFTAYKNPQYSSEIQNYSSFDNIGLAVADRFDNVINQIYIALGGGKKYVSGKLYLFVQRAE